MTRKNALELPPLTEIADASFEAIRNYSSALTIPEILIVGANILPDNTATRRDPRSEEQVRVLNHIALAKIQGLSDMADAIMRELMSGYFDNPKTSRQHVTDYLQKYNLLLGQATPAIQETFNQNTLGYIRQFRRRGGAKKSRNRPSNETVNLQRASTNLTYHEPTKRAGFFVIGKKIKVPERIAHKIPYRIIKHAHEGGDVANARSFLSNITLEDGIIGDIAGLQIVVPDLDSVIKLKEHIAQSDNLEVLSLDNYISGRTGDYQAIHLDVLYSPKVLHENESHRLKDSVEVMITDIQSYFGANFGPASYYRRSQAQKKGIVFKEMGRSGSLRIARFKPFEQAWKNEFEKRVYEILTYNVAAGLRR